MTQKNPVPVLREMERRLIAASEERVSLVFNIIKDAAALIEIVDPDAVLKSWDMQEAILPILDPTAARAIFAAGDDMRRKRQIIEAAANFLHEWNRIKDEALAAETKK